MSGALVEAVLLLVAPSPIAISTSELLEAAARAFAAKTNLSIRSAEQAGVDPTALDCPVAERLSCWVRAVLVDRPPAVLLVIGAHPLDADVRLYAMMVDVGTAQRILGEVASDREEAERRLFRETVRTEPEIVRSAELSSYFDRLVERFQPELQPYWREEIEAEEISAPAPAMPGRLAYDLTLWGGAAVGALGAGIAFAAGALASGGRELCLSRNGSGCAHDRFSAVALGISIGTLGATASLGTLIFEEPGDLPWLEWCVALLAGGAAYSISWAVLR